MSSLLSVNDVRQRVIEMLGTLADPAKWEKSPSTWDRFPSDPGQWSHLAFAVGAPRSKFADAVESSLIRRGDVGGHMVSEIGVRWAFRIRADIQDDDYAAALAAEETMRKAVLGVDSTYLHLSAEDEFNRSVVGDGTWFLGDVIFTAQHRVALR